MRPQAHDVGLVLALVVDPGADQLLAKDAPRRQERVITLERVEGLGERARDLSDATVLFEEVPVRRLAGV